MIKKVIKNWKPFRGLTVLFAFLFILMICVTQIGLENAGSVDAFFGIVQEQSGELNSETMKYKTDFTDDGVRSEEGLAKLVKAEQEYITQVSEDGSVLLKNDDGALPLARQAKVTLFGNAFDKPTYRGISNGSNFSPARGITPLQAFESNFTVNRDVYDAYANGNDGSDLTSVEGTFAEYGDAAIVMLTRQDGEGSDVDIASRELALNDNEKKMLQTAKDGGFDKIIVLLNSGYPMEVDWVDEYNVDALLWIGYPGDTGFQGVSNILCGLANPSGRLVDTYATDSQSAPAMRNVGDMRFANDDSKSYLIYAEGIYVGYKYYETRYEDCVLGQGNANSEAGTYASTSGWNYAEEVSYPFGYGLSYTTFTQEFDGTPEYDAETDTFTVKVKVTNTGDVAGKSVVQVYAQTPYTQYDIENGVEKSAIQLAGFEKTGELAPAGQDGSSTTVTVTIDRYLIASYNTNLQRDGSVTGGYILDAGNYYLSVGDDAHDALNNVLAAKGAENLTDHDGKAVSGNADKAWKYTLDKLDTESYRYSDTGEEVNNKFTSSELFASDYNEFVPDSITYLTRNNWNTYPKTYSGLTVTDQMAKVHNGQFLDDIKAELDEIPEKSDFVNGEYDENNIIKFYEMYGVDFDDPKWDTFINQLTLDQLAQYVCENFGVRALSKFGLPRIYDQDGPDGVKGQYLDSSEYGGAALFNNVGLLSCTFDKELYRLRGYYTGEDCIYLGVSQYWGMGFNNHRTPYGGRNFEYCSEDSIIAYTVNAITSKAINDKGVICAPKHLAANDQETNRGGVMTFVQEQSLREITLKSFESAYTIAHVSGTMSSYNAIGACYTARNGALLTDVVRGEWGFDGFFITDAGSCTDTPILTMAMGTVQFCLSIGSDLVMDALNASSDGYGAQLLRDSAKRILYAYANSLAVNGLAEGTVINESVSWWVVTLYVLDVVFAVVAVASLGMFAYSAYFAKRGKKA